MRIIAQGLYATITVAAGAAAADVSATYLVGVQPQGSIDILFWQIVCIGVAPTPTGTGTFWARHKFSQASAGYYLSASDGINAASTTRNPISLPITSGAIAGCWAMRASTSTFHAGQPLGCAFLGCMIQGPAGTGSVDYDIRYIAYEFT